MSTSELRWNYLRRIGHAFVDGALIVAAIIFAAWFADTTAPDSVRYVGLFIGLGFAWRAAFTIRNGRGK